MPSLRELQTQVVNGLLAAQPDGIAPLVRAAGLAAGTRLRIYQDTVRSNFTDALRSTYPVVRRLVGDDYFRQTAWAFQLTHPSRSGDLNHAGEAFSGHLRALHPDGQYRFLADVATLEWLIQESLLAHDHPPLDLPALGRVETAAYDALHFTLHPTVRLFQSEFPAQRIWEANVGAAEPPLLALDSGGERVAILRQEGQLCFERLSTGEGEFLRSLAEGRSLTAAVECAAGADPGFDAALGLQRFVAANAIVDFTLRDTRL